MQSDAKQIQQFASPIINSIVELLKIENQEFSIIILSISCLLLLSVLPPQVLTPLKYDVLKVLRVKLGDKRRIIRDLAIKTRNIWIITSGNI